MSHANFVVLRSIAAQLLGELDRYERDLEALVDKRWDPALNERSAAAADAIRLCAQACGQAVSVPFTEFLISRAELCHALWSVRSPSRIGGRARALYTEHKAAIGSLRRATQRAAAAGGGAAGSGEGADSALQALRGRRP